MVDKVYALAVRYAHAGQVMENVLHIQKFSAGDPTPAQFLAVANDWKEAWRTAQVDDAVYTDYVATQVLGDGVTYSATNCRQIGGTVTTGVLTGTLAGGDTNDPLPAMATASLNCHTGLRGRSYRTKFQIGSFSEQYQSNGLFTAGFLTSMDGYAATFLAKYGSGGTDTNWLWGTFSRGIASGCFPDLNTRHHPLVHRQAGNVSDAFHPITEAYFGPHVTTTRSRIR